MPTSSRVFTCFYLNCRRSPASQLEASAVPCKRDHVPDDGVLVEASSRSDFGRRRESAVQEHRCALVKWQVNGEVVANAFSDTAVVASAQELHICFAPASADVELRKKGLGGNATRFTQTRQPPLLGEDLSFAEFASTGSPSQCIVKEISRPIGGNHVSSVACGFNHVLLATSSGRAFSLGANSSGQLGTGGFSSSQILQAVKFDAKVSVRSVHAGGDFSVAVCATGNLCEGGSEEGKELVFPGSRFVGDALFTWGSNDFGQLGRRRSEADETRSPTPSPIEFEPSSDAEPSQQGVGHSGDAVRSGKGLVCTYTAVACGAHHTVALTAQGQVVAFGLNIHGQLGLGTLSPWELPSLMPLSGENAPRRRFVQVACSPWKTALVTEEGEAYTVGVSPTYSPPPPIPWSRAPKAGGSGRQDYDDSDAQSDPLQSAHAYQGGNGSRNPSHVRPTSQDASDEHQPRGTCCSPCSQDGDAEPFLEGPLLSRLSFLPGKVKNISLGPTLSCAVIEDAHENESLFCWKSEEQHSENQPTFIHLSSKRSCGDCTSTAEHVVVREEIGMGQSGVVNPAKLQRRKGNCRSPWFCHAGSEGVFVWSY